MFKKKNILYGVSLLVLGMLGGCGSSQEQASNNGEWEWERKVEIICPWGTGGGADTTTRTFATALEKELGVPVVVNNRAGAGGVSGIEFGAKQPADGYTYIMSTPSPLLAQIAGATDYDVYGALQPLVQMVHDVNIFVTSAKAPYNNYEELMAYVEENPGKVKAGVMTITGLDAACVIGAFGDMKPIMSASEKRLTLPGFENVQCAGELGLDALFGPARGIFYVKGTPEEALKSFETAAEKAVNSEFFQNWVKTEGLDQRPGWKNREDFKTQWDQDYKDLTELFGKK